MDGQLTAWYLRRVRVALADNLEQRVCAEVVAAGVQVHPLVQHLICIPEYRSMLDGCAASLATGSRTPSTPSWSVGQRPP